MKCDSLNVLLSGLTTLNSLLGGCSFKLRAQCCNSFVHVSFHTYGRNTFSLKAMHLLCDKHKTRHAWLPVAGRGVEAYFELV